MLKDTNLVSLLRALHTNQLEHAIAALRFLPAAREYAEAVELLGQCHGDDRERLRVLLVDILSGYPKVIWAVPILMYFRTSRAGMLTLPSIDTRELPPDVAWAGWQSTGEALPEYTFPSLAIPVNCPVCMLLAIRTEGAEAPTIDDSWLAGVFSDIPRGGTLQVASGPVLPYPEGVEAGVLMNAISRRADTSDAPATTRYFLRDRGWAKSVETALAYRERVLITVRRGIEVGRGRNN